jgi:hypothetical protein
MCFDGPIQFSRGKQIVSGRNIKLLVCASSIAQFLCPLQVSFGEIGLTEIAANNPNGG